MAARTVGRGSTRRALRRAAHPAAYASFMAGHPVTAVTVACGDEAVTAAINRLCTSLMEGTVSAVPDTTNRSTDRAYTRTGRGRVRCPQLCTGLHPHVDARDFCHRSARSQAPTIGTGHTDRGHRTHAVLSWDRRARARPVLLSGIQQWAVHDDVESSLSGTGLATRCADISRSASASSTPTSAAARGRDSSAVASRPNSVAIACSAASRCAWAAANRRAAVSLSRTAVPAARVAFCHLRSRAATRSPVDPMTPLPLHL